MSQTRPAEKAVAITPQDSIEIPITRGVYVATTGDLVVRMLIGGVVTFPNIAPGIIHPIKVKGIEATGTTATGVIALY
jgi:hypothetical protein